MAGSDSQRSLERFEAGSKTVSDNTNAMIRLTANKTKSQCKNFTKREVPPSARIFHESLAATTYMTFLPGVLGCWPLRRTVKVRLGTNPAVRGTVARWHAHLRGLATAIHETSRLVRLNGRVWHQGNVPGSFYRHGYLPLVSGTVARNPPGDYFSSLRNKILQLFCILIINFQL